MELKKKKKHGLETIRLFDSFGVMRYYIVFWVHPADGAKIMGEMKKKTKIVFEMLFERDIPIQRRLSTINTKINYCARARSWETRIRGNKEQNQTKLFAPNEIPSVDQQSLVDYSEAARKQYSRDRHRWRSPYSRENVVYARARQHTCEPIRHSPFIVILLQQQRRAAEKICKRKNGPIVQLM